MKDRTYPRRGLHGSSSTTSGCASSAASSSPATHCVMDAEADGETVSRTVVREAIKVLAAKGLVVARPRTGTQVRDRRYWNLMDPDVLAWRLEANPGDDFFVDVFELRRLIEPAAAGLAAAARRARPRSRSSRPLWRTWRRRVDDRDAYLAADLRFHTVILEACHNELLAHLGGTLRAVFRASFARTLPIARETIGQHAAVAAAIREGDERGSRGCDARPDRAHGGQPRRRRLAAAGGPSPTRLTADVSGVLEQHLRDDAVAVVHQRERVLEPLSGKAVRHDRVELDESLLEQPDDVRPRPRSSRRSSRSRPCRRTPSGRRGARAPCPRRRCRAARRARRGARAAWRDRPRRRRRPSRRRGRGRRRARPCVAAIGILLVDVHGRVRAEPWRRAPAPRGRTP